MLQYYVNSDNIICRYTLDFLRGLYNDTDDENDYDDDGNDDYGIYSGD